jgi:hypothetical protein
MEEMGGWSVGAHAKGYVEGKMQSFSAEAVRWKDWTELVRRKRMNRIYSIEPRIGTDRALIRLRAG